MFLVFTVIIEVCCRGGDRQLGMEKWGGEVEEFCVSSEELN